MGESQLEHSDHKSVGKLMPICILAHDIDVPMNVGSLFRLADALGVEKLFLTGRTAVPPNKKIRKTSRATEKYVNYDVCEDPQEIVQTLRVRGYTVVSLEITDKSVDIRKASLHRGEMICLIVGSENSGISQKLLDLSDHIVHIPMLGANSSMNVATACSIAVYEIIGKIAP